MYPTPRSWFRRHIERWEGAWQEHPADVGNYVRMPDGARRLIGTMRGVTPAAFARYRGIPAHDVTAEMLRTEVTLDVAAAIAVTFYYRLPRFHLLTTHPLVEIASDIGWGSGPARGVRMLQRQIGADVDGAIGPRTQDAYETFIAKADVEPAIVALTAARAAFYRRISDPQSHNPRHRANHVFRNGWLRRANHFVPTNPRWWRNWTAWDAVHDPVPEVSEPLVADDDTPAIRPVDPFDGARDPIDTMLETLHAVLGDRVDLDALREVA